ncbi:uncharacterized protein LOC143363803 [Halictus rubicundus]|uniref:uncharacterized protein LOC143363803 n=1 Tax=Halictus rubicundus TaxID=77578 RepID=UPI0040353730
MARTGDNLQKQGKANLTIGLLQSTLATLEKRWQQFEEQDDRIRSTATPEDHQSDYFTLDIFTEGEQAYSLQKGQLLDALARLAPASTPASPSIPPPAASGPRARSTLPRIDLPAFSGRYSEWTRYKDLFSSLVLDDPSWSDAEKFHYLSASLTGEAALLIRRIPMSADNFHRAWELLAHRYENRRLLVDAQFDILYETPACTTHTARELKRLLDTSCNVASVLNGLDVPVDDKAHWMVQHVVRRLDAETLKHWETSLGSSTEPPTLSELLEFLETTIRTLEACESRHGHLVPAQRPAAKGIKAVHVATDQPSTKSRCGLCRGNHLLCFCGAFRSKTPLERLQVVTSSQLCHNCLGPHAVAACRSNKTCQRCAEKHHTMLHDALVQGNRPPRPTAMHIVNGPEPSEEPLSVLLATALVAVQSAGGTVVARALIDPCSEVSLVSESLVQQLRLHRTSCSQVVVGAGAKATATARGRTRLDVASRIHANLSCTVEALILPRLTSYRPRCRTFASAWPHISGLTLADPTFNSATPIDLLLGADVYPQVLLTGTRSGGHRGPVAQETIFGWILSGPATSPGPSTPIATSHTVTIDDLTALVRRFWEQEEMPPPAPQRTAEEAACEEHFQRTHSRQPDGRYVVRLCLTTPNPELGQSHCIARRILLANERRFATNPQLQALYTNFMEEYRTLGHMQVIPAADYTPRRPHFYLPHHGVLKATGTSTKLRVVFNGSRRSSVGTSINAHLAAGPKLQQDITNILLRWRRHKVAFIADIEKMYRQIRVHSDDWDLQRILWRDNESERIDAYHLTTVTYGLTCAPYLALRTLLQLAEDEKQRFPRGASILRTATYVDDILAGADSIEDAERTQGELIGICKAGGFVRKKWSANHSALLSALPADFLAESSTIPWHPETGCSALGLTWHPATDTLAFSLHAPSETTSEPPTKRRVLSQIAKLFDPLGWLAPFVVRGKIFIQDLWKTNLEWDERLPPDTAAAWNTLREDMDELACIRIPRWLGVDDTAATRQLHAFVDASEKAYAAAVYVRIEDSHGVARAHLVAAKTKVAPLKTVSLPRLELCAATLGARLLVHIRQEIQVPIDAVHLWSDSTVALAWLQGEPTRWRTYIANRVSEVQTALPDGHLHHVGTKDNPADCASRGVAAAQLASHPLWWHGPSWLTSPEAGWNTAPPPHCTTEEERTPATCLQTSRQEDPELLLRFSTLDRLLRATSWCLRWTSPSRRDATASPPHLRPDELRRAEETWIRLVQRLHFATELTAVEQQKPVPGGSGLRKLTPFLDEYGILRVGGRLHNALLPYNEQHPIILPAGCHLTQLVIESAHLRTLHGGVQLTLAALRQKYWIPQGRRQVKRCTSHCLRCIRWRAAPATQVMGNLPTQRVTPSRPFQHVGLDYAGPFQLKTTPGRGHKATKGYVAVFICFSTRAVHIEAVSDYSTAAFLAAFRRFTGRRGTCSSLTSDCGTNFVGADRELRRLFTASTREAASIGRQLAKDGVTWKFIPPGAPHFGGLWEAAVRSLKHHLRRVVADDPLTYEEFSTLLCQVEACLNSRPLQALTDDPEDLTPLTPGHFLVGGPLTAVPEPTLLEVPRSRLTRWQLLQQRLQHFWRRWAAEYLHQLQTRPKWTTAETSLQLGDLVLIKSELTPPSRWPLGRIDEVHPGADGHVRVATVKTATSRYQRPVTKLIPLHRAADA